MRLPLPQHFHAPAPRARVSPGRGACASNPVWPALAAALLLAAGTACRTVHCSSAVLLERLPADPPSKTETYQLVTNHPAEQAPTREFVSGNPIRIARSCDFRLDISELSPGWIHEGLAPRLPAAGDSGWSSRQDEWEKPDREHLRGNELWLLTIVRALDVDDPLQLKTKTYIRSTNIKYDSESFSLIPFDAAESRIFEHGADSSYRVSFRLYEVDGIELKRLVAGAARDNSGLWDAAGNVFAGLKGAAAALLGSPGQKLIEKFENEPIFFERLLLESGGTLEFQGSVTILVCDQPLGDTSPKQAGAAEAKPESRSRDFILLDPIKSGWFGQKPGETLFTDAAGYRAVQQHLREQVFETGPDQEQAGSSTYLKLQVTESAASTDERSAEARQMLTELQDYRGLAPDAKSRFDWPKHAKLREFLELDAGTGLAVPQSLDRAERILSLKARTNPKD